MTFSLKTGLNYTTQIHDYFDLIYEFCLPHILTCVNDLAETFR